MPKLTQRWSAAWPMVALCLIGGSRWILEGSLPAARSTYATQAVGSLGAAGVLAVAGLWSERRKQGSAPRVWLESRTPHLLKTTIGGVFALTGTGVAAMISRSPIHADDATLALAIAPCVIAVGTAALGSTAGQEMTARLWPGLAAVAGLLLLLPQPRVNDWRFGIALAAMPLCTGLGAAFVGAGKVLSKAGDGPPRQRAALPLILLGASAVCGMLAYIQGAGEGSLRTAFAVTKGAVSLDGSMAFLTILTLIRFGAIRWSAQFILLPLVALLEGVVLLRPQLDGRSWLAFGLLLISGTYLFCTKDAPMHVSLG